MPENKTTAELPADRRSAPNAPQTPDQKKREEISQDDISRVAQRAPMPNQAPGTNPPGAPLPQPTPSTPGMATAPNPPAPKLPNREAAIPTPGPAPSQTVGQVPDQPMIEPAPPAGPSRDDPRAKDQAGAPQEAGAIVGTAPMVQETRPQVSMPDDPEVAKRILERKVVLPSGVQVSEAEGAAEEAKRLAEAGVPNASLPEASRGQAFAAPAGVQQRVK